MTLDEARSVLGLDRGADRRAEREAFLRLVRGNHPDVTHDPDGAAERTATIISAYRLLRDAPDAAEPPAPQPSSARPAGTGGAVEVITDEALWVGAPLPLVTRALLVVADDLGEVSYVDRSGGLVQLTVRPPAGPTCWFTVSAHGRPGGTALVATLESIEARPTPPAAELMTALAHALAEALDGGLDRDGGAPSPE